MARFAVATIGEGLFLEARRGVPPVVVGTLIVLAALAALALAAGGRGAETLAIAADAVAIGLAVTLGQDRRLGHMLRRARRTISVAPRRRFDPAAPGVRAAAIFEPVLDIDGEAQPSPRGVVVRRSGLSEWTVYVLLADGALLVDDFRGEAPARALAEKLAAALRLPPPEGAPALSFRPGNPPAWAIVGLALAHVAALSLLTARLARPTEHPWRAAAVAAVVVAVLGAISYAVVVRAGARVERARWRRDLG